MPPLRLDADPREPGPPQVQRAPAPAVTGSPSGCSSSGASSPAAARARARRARSRSRSGDGGTSPSVSCGQLLRRRPGVDQRPGDPVLAGQHRLAEERRRAARPAPSTASPGEGGDEPGPGRDPGVDRLGGEVVVQRDVRPRDPRHRRHRVVARRRPSGTRSSARRSSVGSRSRTVRRPRRRTRRTTRRSRASVIGSSSSGSQHRAQRGPDGVPEAPLTPATCDQPGVDQQLLARLRRRRRDVPGGQLALGGHLDVVELRGVQPEDLLLARSSSSRG